MTELKGGERTHTILYKLYRRENEWRGYDVEINGISTTRSFRAQYEPSLRDGGMERLLDEMRKRQ